MNHHFRGPAAPPGRTLFLAAVLIASSLVLTSLAAPSADTLVWYAELNWNVETPNDVLGAVVLSETRSVIRGTVYTSSLPLEFNSTAASVFVSSSDCTVAPSAAVNLYAWQTDAISPYQPIALVREWTKSAALNTARSVFAVFPATGKQFCAELKAPAASNLKRRFEVNNFPGNARAMNLAFSGLGYGSVFASEDLTFSFLVFEAYENPVLTSTSSFYGHVHNKRCNDNNAGLHWKYNNSGPTASVNEIWYYFNTPTEESTTYSSLSNSAGSVWRSVVQNRRVGIPSGDPEFRSIVVHNPDNSKMLCWNLATVYDFKHNQEYAYAYATQWISLDGLTTATGSVILSNKGSTSKGVIKVRLSSPLVGNAVFYAHVHNQACSNNNAGGHWRYKKRLSDDQPTNEFWWKFVGTKSSGEDVNLWSSSSVNNNFPVTDSIKSVVIHKVSGAKMVCADLNLVSDISEEAFELLAASDSIATAPSANPENKEFVSLDGVQTARGYASVWASSTRTMSILTFDVDKGILNNASFASHLHAKPCSESKGGGHWMYNYSGPVDTTNEFWHSWTGSGDGSSRMNLFSSIVLNPNFAIPTGDPGMRSFVVHAPGGAKMICVDLKTIFDFEHDSEYLYAYGTSWISLDGTRNANGVAVLSNNGYTSTGTIQIEVFPPLVGTGVLEAHVHNLPCKTSKAGKHWRFKPLLSDATTKNEFWWTFALTESSSTTERSILSATVTNLNFPLTDSIVSIVVHNLNGAKMVCTDLNLVTELSLESAPQLVSRVQEANLVKLKPEYSGFVYSSLWSSSSQTIMASSLHFQPKVSNIPVVAFYSSDSCQTASSVSRNIIDTIATSDFNPDSLYGSGAVVEIANDLIQNSKADSMKSVIFNIDSNDALCAVVPPRAAPSPSSDPSSPSNGPSPSSASPSSSGDGEPRLSFLNMLLIALGAIGAGALLAVTGVAIRRCIKRSQKPRGSTSNVELLAKESKVEPSKSQPSPP